MTERNFKEEICNNKVIISGQIKKSFILSHEVFGEKFYKTEVINKRTSGIEDTIPIIVSDRILEIKNTAGKWVEVIGEFRSFDSESIEGKSHLELFVFVKEINIYENEEELAQNTLTNKNFILLDGYLCKKPTYRKTPKTDREISDLIVAVNRRYKKSDYIPCVTWGRFARWAGGFEIGDRVKIEGRIQSRTYFKRYSLDSFDGEVKTVYEVSVEKIEIMLPEYEERLLEY